MIGTPNYMAPETLAGKGYSFPADLWSLGIVLFEFMAGFVPFGEDAEDPLQIYQEIIKNSLKFPKNMKDQNMNAFISLLLNKNPETRLGGSFTNLKKNTIFSNIEWVRSYLFSINSSAKRWNLSLKSLKTNLPIFLASRTRPNP